MAIRGTVWVSWSCQSECGHCQHSCLLYRRGDERRPSSGHFEYWWVWLAQAPQRYRHLGIAPCNTQVIGFGSLRAILTAGSSSTEEALGEVGSSVNRFATISGYIACLHDTPRLRGSHQHHPPHHSHWLVISKSKTLHQK